MTTNKWMRLLMAMGMTCFLVVGFAACQGDTAGEAAEDDMAIDETVEPADDAYGDDMGAMDEGAVDDGMMDEGAVDDGMMDEGAMDDGMMDEGAMDDGMMDEGAMDEGAMDEGAVDPADDGVDG